MKFRNLAMLLAGSLAMQTVAQDCPPPTIPLNSTVRTLDSNQIIVEGNYDGDTRQVVSLYQYPVWAENQIGTMNVTGNITFTNKSTQTRKMTYRMSVLLPEGAVPQFTDLTASDGSALCWEELDSRIVVVYEVSLNAGQTREVPVNWSATIRGLLFADLNNDLRVDALDQAILVDAFGTSDPLADLNNDGIVDAADLELLLFNWSDYSDDVIETSNATPINERRIAMDDVEYEEMATTIAESSKWFESADVVVAGVMSDNFNAIPMPVGVQAVQTVPFHHWRRST